MEKPLPAGLCLLFSEERKVEGGLWCRKLLFSPKAKAYCIYSTHPARKSNREKDETLALAQPKAWKPEPDNKQVSRQITG